MQSLKHFSLICVAANFLIACDNDIDYHVGQDQHHVRVYKDDEQLACQPDTAISVRDHGLLLAEENIELHCSQKGADGISYPESCGSDTGSINIFTIHKGDLDSARDMGFSELSSLPQASLNRHCEFQVISDRRKFYLLHDVKANIQIWQSADIADYRYDIKIAYQDCTSDSRNGEFRVQVESGAITEVMDLSDNSILNDISNFYTMDGLLNEIKLAFWMSPFAAGKSVNEVDLLPPYRDNGTIKSVYFDSGTPACDAPLIEVSEFTPLS